MRFKIEVPLLQAPALGQEVPLWSASGSGSSSSSRSGSGNDKSGTGSPEKSQAPTEDSDSGSSEQSHSASPKVVLVGEGKEDVADGEEEEGSSDYEETLLQGMVSLLEHFQLR